MKSRAWLLAVTAVTAFAACSAETPVAPDPLPAGSSPTQPVHSGDSPHEGRPLSAALTGAAVVPGPGDPDGSGSALLTLNAGREQICFRLSVSNIAPVTDSWISRGAAGEQGTHVLRLTSETSTSLSGCTAATRALVREIIRNPSGFHVEVDNMDHPTALRGQLTR